MKQNARPMQTERRLNIVLQNGNGNSFFVCYCTLRFIICFSRNCHQNLVDKKYILRIIVSENDRKLEYLMGSSNTKTVQL